MSTKEPGELEGTGASSDEQLDQGGHPLFPRPETATGPDTRKFDLIIIYRWLPDGTKEVCSRTFKGSELRSWQQITDMYGGGTYQLGAQCEKTHQWQAWTEKTHFASPARKPFQDEPKVSDAAHGQAPIPANQQPPPQASSTEMVTLLRTLLEQHTAAQARTQDLIFKIALEKQSKQPSALETMREYHEISKLTAQTARKAEVTEFAPAVARDDDFTAADVIKGIGTALVELMKWKASQREQHQAQQATPAPQPERAPAPVPEMHEPPQIIPTYLDHATGIRYVFVNGMGWRPVVDPAFYGHTAAHQIPQPPQQYGYPPGYPYPYPHPATAWGPPMAAPMPPMPQPAQPPTPQPVPQPVPPMPQPAQPPMPQPMPQPAQPRPQPQPARAPKPQTMAHPVPQPIPYTPSPPVPQPQPAPHPPSPPPVPRAPQPSPEPSPSPPLAAHVPFSEDLSPEPNAPLTAAELKKATDVLALVPRGTNPWGRVAENATNPMEALAAITDNMSQSVGPDFAEVVMEAVNSPLSRSLQEHPQFRAMQEAVSNGTMTDSEAQSGVIELLGSLLAGGEK